MLMLAAAAPATSSNSTTSNALEPDIIFHYECQKKYSDPTCGGPPYLTKAKRESLCGCDAEGEPSCNSFKLCTGAQVKTHRGSMHNQDCYCSDR